MLAAAFPSLGIGFVGVSLAFGWTMLTMAHAIGGERSQAAGIEGPADVSQLPKAR